MSFQGYVQNAGEISKEEFWREGYEKGKLEAQEEITRLKAKIEDLKNQIEIMELRKNQ